jgi:predicted transcriptional regulator
VPDKNSVIPGGTAVAKSAVKLAMRLPPEDFRKMESLRRKLRTTRSAVVRQALRTYFQAW